MKTLLSIGIGSFIGGALRYLVAQQVQKNVLSTFPFGTLSVNIVGCFLIGLVFALSDRGNLSQEWRLFLATGICGGFTTFSAFSNETIALLRDGQFLYAGLYVISSIILGLAATFLGYAILKGL
ncbi:MAG: fluoride efflux transporter CrcB [Candidatus Thermochlorobacter sp.]